MGGRRQCSRMDSLGTRPTAAQRNVAIEELSAQYGAAYMDRLVGTCIQRKHILSLPREHLLPTSLFIQDSKL